MVSISEKCRIVQKINGILKSGNNKNNNINNKTEQQSILEYSVHLSATTLFNSPSLYEPM